MSNPYESLKTRAFWSPSVARRHMLDIDELWRPDFEISNETKIATFGSCFAQHFARALLKRGFTWLDCEPAPSGVSEKLAKKYNYGVFSARTANIYTASLFFQWVEWALDLAPVPEIYWINDKNRYIDPFRPTIEPDGFSSVDEMFASRQTAIKAFSNCLSMSDVFVFTLGLTESWWDKELGLEYPLCPGTVAGVFDESKHVFVNQDYSSVYASLANAISAIQDSRKNELHFLLTVSPVPLVATNSSNHVLVATMESKSILRAVAGAVSRNQSSVSYFPSYEIINSPPYKGFFFEQNLRGVSAHGVNHVMHHFFSAFNSDTPVRKVSEMSAGKMSNDDVVCEEELMSAFGDEE